MATSKCQINFELIFFFAKLKHLLNVFIGLLPNKKSKRHHIACYEVSLSLS